MIHYWNDLTSPELAGLAGEGAVAVMVLGAIEQHGPHLPLATDLIIGEGLLNAALEMVSLEHPLVVLPSLAIGASEEHGHFAGTLSLSPAQAAATIVAVGEGIHRPGIKRLVLVNSHGGNHAAMATAALDLRRRLGMLVVKASYMRFAPPAELIGAEELRQGLHGGQAETAMMLHLNPGLVRSDRARNFSPRERAGQSPPLGPEGQAAWAWLAEDLNAAGVVGRADRASAGLGQQLIAHYSQILATVLQQAATLDISDFKPDASHRPA